jgi:hypothetical protein
MMPKKMEDLIKYCAADNLNTRLAAGYEPKRVPEIKSLPIYRLKDIAKLSEMFTSSSEFISASETNPNWFSSLKGIKTCISLYSVIDNISIGEDIVEILLAPFEDMPIYINTPEPRLKLFVKWRLSIGR